MKSHNLLLTVFCLATMAIALSSCDSCNNKKESYEFVTADDSDVDSAFQSNKAMFMIASKGPVWETWKKLHNACMQDEFFKKPKYLGISNTVDLGSVYSKSGDVLEWDFNKLFSAQDRKKVINSGQPQPCTYTEQLKVDFEAFIATELPSTGIDDELSTAIRNQKDISVKIDNWQIDNLVKGELKIILDASTDPKIQQFKSDLINKNLIMVAQAARINGFSSIINLNTDISASLKAELEKGIIKNIGNSEAKVKFEYSSARQIKVTSQGSFVVFVEFINAKRVNS